MIVKNTLIASYDNQGHHQYPEDTWNQKTELRNVDDLYTFMKDIHRENASSFSNYPFGGFCSMDWFTFYNIRWVEVDGEKFISKITEPLDKPEYFNEAEELFNIYVKRLESSLKFFRGKKEKKDKERKERAELDRLKKKFDE